MNTVSEMMNYLWMVFFRYIGATIITSFLFVFFYMYVRRLGIRKTFALWFLRIRKDKHFRLVLALAICVFFILFNTVFCRRIIENPLANALGTFVLVDFNGRVNIDGISNILLFIPYGVVLCCVLSGKNSQNYNFLEFRVVYGIFKNCFLFALLIEIMQLIFSIGTFQLSDICYNVIGGVIGGIMFVVLGVLKCILKKRCKDGK